MMPLPAPGVGRWPKRKKSRGRLLSPAQTFMRSIGSETHVRRSRGAIWPSWARPATVIALILSDVIGDNLSSIGSGPTVLGSQYGRGCRRVLKRYGIRVPKLTETPKRPAGSS